MIYILRSDGVYCRYEGQTMAQINAGLAERGLTGTVIAKAAYDAAIAAVTR